MTIKQMKNELNTTLNRQFRRQIKRLTGDMSKVLLIQDWYKLIGIYNCSFSEIADDDIRRMYDRTYDLVMPMRLVIEKYKGNEGCDTLRMHLEMKKKLYEKILIGDLHSFDEVIG